MSKETRNFTIAIVIMIYLVIGMLFSPAGFMTEAIKNKAGENLYSDQVLSVVSAHVNTSGGLSVCVKGIYDLVERQYWIRVPLRTISEDPESIDGIDGFNSYWRDLTTERIWYLPRNVIEPVSCTEMIDEPLREIRVRKLRAAMTGSISSLDIIDELVVAESPGEVILEMKVNDGAGELLEVRDLAYSNPEMSFGLSGRQAFTFSTGTYTRQGNKNWFWLLPPAWIGDVLTWPVQLWMWSEYASAH